MQIIENSKIKEKLYVEKLKNGLTVMILPKKTRKKYIVWSINYGSIDGMGSICCSYIKCERLSNW